MAHPDDTRRLGHWLIIGSCVLALALLTALFGGWLDRRDKPNQSVAGVVRENGANEVVLLQNSAGHYVAGGLINDQPVTFLLDTGATSVSVPESLAHRLGLARGAAYETHTANGVITTYATRLHSVAIGNIARQNVRAHINPHASGDEVLLGMTFLRHLELTQRDRELTIRQVRP